MPIILGRKPGGAGGGGAPSGPAGGDLSGTYPDPTIAAGVVEASMLDSGAATDGQVATADGAGGVAYETPALVLVHDSTLGGDAASFDVQNIPGTYKHLRAILIARSTRAAQTEDIVEMRFNNDSGNNYDIQQMQVYDSGNFNSVTVIGSGTTVLAQDAFTQIGTLPAASSPAGAAGHVIIDIPGYAGTTFRKTVTSHCSGPLTDVAQGMRNWLSAGEWLSTAAITRITLLSANGANFLAGSRLTIYAFN